MPLITTTVIQEIVTIFNADATIKAFTKYDIKNNPSIRVGHFNQTGAIFPSIYIIWSPGKSDSLLPHESGTLTIQMYVDKEHLKPYETLNNIKDYIKTLFNREGEDFTRVDVPTNSGIRFNQFTKQSEDLQFDEDIKKYYAELIFEVEKSEGESFLASDAGDKTWV